MTKLTEIKQQKQELNSLVNSANFLNDFQKQNYNLLIDNYYEPAEDLARDYDTSKSHYDRLTDTDPKKSQYKAKMDKSESGLSPYLEALTKLKTEISTMEQILNKITGLETKIDNLKTTTGTTDPNLVKPCPCDITGLDKKIDDLKTAVINKDKRTAVLSIQNNKSMSEYNTREGNKYPVFSNNPEAFLKGIKEEPNKSHVFLRQDPITKLWGVVYANKGASDRVFYFSPNVSRNQEAERVRQWLKDQGATQYLNDWVPSPSYSDKYKNTDQQFSLIWSLGFLGITAREWNKTPEGSMNWEDFNDESKWRPVGEVELEKYGN